MYNADDVKANPIAYSFSMGTGYKLLGPLRLPSTPLGPASACEPTVPADEGSWHRIIPMGQLDGIYIRAQWNPSKKIWTPPLEAQGRRVAFTSQYLAAHGWTYGEAE
jgi:hypothetical protein